MPSKMLTNYDSMFSDLPNYPRQQQVTWEVSGSRHLGQNLGDFESFSTGGGDVIGRDRAKFFKRPILPNSMPLPFIRYAKEISQSEEDVEKRRHRYRQLFDDDSSDYQIRPGQKVSFGTQTDFREIEVQTEPCTLNYDEDENVKRRPEVTSLTLLRHGRGLPATTDDDLDLVDELCRQRALEDRLPPAGDPRRSVIQKTLLQKRQAIQNSLDQKTSMVRMSQRSHQMAADVQQFSEVNSRMLEERLERLWRHKQKEKEDRMKVIRKIHDKEQKFLQKKCQDLNNFLHKGTFKKVPTFQERLSRSAAGQSENSNPPFSDPLISRPTTSNRIPRSALDDEFLTTYNGLRALEKETNSRIASCVNAGQKKVVKQTEVKPKTAIVYPTGYVRRGDRYRHTLDTAFDEIQDKKKLERQNSGTDQAIIKKQQLYDYFRVPDSNPSTASDYTEKSPKKYSYLSEEEDLEKAKELKKEVERNRTQRRTLEVSLGSENRPDHQDESENQEALVDAFMDEIEGETLGQMLNYLSSELESSTDGEEAVKHVDLIYQEITKVTQSTVDRYLDTILLDTLYKHAGKSAERETERSDPDGERRCSSASESEAKKNSSRTRIEPVQAGFRIKHRIKDFQRQHLLAAGESLYAVLAEMKSRGEVFHENRDEVEQNIREALQEFCRPEHLERELRKAMATLNLDVMKEKSNQQ